MPSKKSNGKGKAKAKSKRLTAVPSAPSVPNVPAESADAAEPVEMAPPPVPDFSPKRAMSNASKDSSTSDRKSSKSLFYALFGKHMDDVSLESGENFPLESSAGPIDVKAVGKARKPLVTHKNKAGQQAASMVAALETVDTNAGPSTATPSTAAKSATAKSATGKTAISKPTTAPTVAFSSRVVPDVPVLGPALFREPIPSTVPPPQVMEEALALARQLCAARDTVKTNTDLGSDVDLPRKYPVSHKTFREAMLVQERIDLANMPFVKTIFGRGDLYIALALNGKVDEVFRVSSECLSNLSDYFREIIDVLRVERGKNARQLKMIKNAPPLKTQLAALYPDHVKLEDEEEEVEDDESDTKAKGKGKAKSKEEESKPKFSIVLPSDDGLKGLKWFIGKTLCINLLCPAETTPPLPKDTSKVDMMRAMLEHTKNIPGFTMSAEMAEGFDGFFSYHKMGALEVFRDAFYPRDPDDNAERDREYRRFPPPPLPKALKPAEGQYKPPNKYRDLPHGGPFHRDCQECEPVPERPVAKVPQFGLFPDQIAKFHYTFTDEATPRLPTIASQKDDADDGVEGYTSEEVDDDSFVKYPVPITGMIHIDLSGNVNAELQLQQLTMILHAVHGHPDYVGDALNPDEFWHLLQFAERLGMTRSLAPFINAWRATFAENNPEPKINPTATDNESVDGAVVTKLRVGFAIGCAKTVQDAMRFVAWHMTLEDDPKDGVVIKMPFDIEPKVKSEKPKPGKSKLTQETLKN
ncbi:hypothetical protein SBRCBS47491_003447 [Sporothrix bragantina]|uniref:BTB domain-containing protein n=1 Tax=Sporothrix bragantina TaxID=671064 RepID=A0ABP0BGJ5_9PEZI